MKSKLKSPDFVASLKAAAYKIRLKAELAMLKTEDQPQRFLLMLDHKFGDGATDPLFVVGYGSDWKAFRKENQQAANFAAGHCEFTNHLNNPMLNFSIEKGKAKDRAIIAAFKKHAVLKEYALKFELSPIADEEEDDLKEVDSIEKEMGNVQLKDKNSKEVFQQIKKALDEFKLVSVHDFKTREIAMKKVEGLIKIWKANHPTPYKGDDAKIATQISTLETWLQKQTQHVETNKDHAIGLQLIDKVVKYTDALKTASGKNYQELHDKLSELNKEIILWEQTHQSLVKQDKVIATQYNRLNTANKKIPAILQQLSKAINQKKQPDQNLKGMKNAVPNAGDFLKSANLLVGDNPELDSIIKRMEQLQDSHEGGPSLDDQMQDMLDDGVTDYNAFKEVFDKRTDQLYSLRNEINAFLKKNKGLLSQVTDKQKKRVKAVESLLDSVESELSNSSKILFNMSSIADPIVLFADSEFMKTVEPIMQLTYNSNLYKAAQMIQSKAYRDAKGYQGFLNMLVAGELNIGTNGTQLAKLYKGVEKSPNPQPFLDKLFAKDTPASALIAKIVSILAVDFKSALDDMNREKGKAQAAIMNSVEVQEMTALIRAAQTKNFETIGELEADFKNMQKKLDALQQQFDKMPENNPKKATVEANLYAFQELVNTYKNTLVKIEHSKNQATDLAKDIKTTGEGIFDLLAKKTKMNVTNAFIAFATSEFGEENIEALQELVADKMKGNVFAKKYILDEVINVGSEDIKTVCDEANNLDKPTKEYKNFIEIPDQTWDVILVEGTKTHDKIRKSIQLNLVDTYSRFCSLTPVKLVPFC